MIGRSDLAVLGQWLKQHVGNRPVGILRGRSAEQTTFHYQDGMDGVNFERATLPFDRFVDAVLASAEEPATPNLYLQGTLARNLSRSLARAFALPHVPPSSEPSLWMGNQTTAQTHFDLSQNVAVVVSGQRRFTLFPPDQVANLYMSPVETAPLGTPISMVKLDDPDPARHPRFPEALARAQVAELEAGDAIFIPYMWWHRVEAAGALTMLVNFWWNEYDHFGSPLHTMLHAILTLRDLPEPMRSGWKAMFDHFVFGEGAAAMDHVPPQLRGGLGPLDDLMRHHLWRGVAAGIEPHLRAPPPGRPRP